MSVTTGGSTSLTTGSVLSVDGVVLAVVVVVLAVACGELVESVVPEVEVVGGGLESVVELSTFNVLLSATAGEEVAIWPSV